MLQESLEVDVHILGSKHKPPSVSLAYLKFVTIHPFIDGNGGVARLLMNFALTSNGFPTIAIKSDDESRNRYNKSLEHAIFFSDLILSIIKVNLSKRFRK